MSKKSDVTKSKILDAAIKLFNKQGTAFVNTHHIAAEAGLSPGNLYYHFRDKREILIAVFEQMELFSAAGWEKRASEKSAGKFSDFLGFFFSQLRTHRFFFREQAELLRANKNLAAKWKESHHAISTAMHAAARHWVREGIMVPFRSGAEIDAFTDNCWIISSFAYSFLEARGKKTDAEAQALKQVLAFLRPYHTEKGQKILDKFKL